MARTDNPIAAVVRHVEWLAFGPTGRDAASRWAALRPELEGWGNPADLAAGIRSATPDGRDRLIGLLLLVCGEDPLAQLTVVAGLSAGLGKVAAGWSSAGVTAGEETDVEADLVAGCWTAVVTVAASLAEGGGIPERVGLHLVDEAREAVRVPRRRERRISERRIPLDFVEAQPDPRPGARTAAEELARHIADAVDHQVITVAAARPVFLTRVAGFDVADAAARLSCTPGVLRAVRSRAERALIAA